jgi:hypothetical protein
MHFKWIFSALALGVIACLLPCSARADDGWDRAVFMLTEENDSGLSDRHYTQGAKLTLLSSDYATNHFTALVPSVGYHALRWKWGGEFGQQMFTPEMIGETTLIQTDRPYAGWLYGGLIFQQRGTNSRGSAVMETFRLDAGVAGPESQADNTQIWWHSVWGFQRPNGWRHQIHTEVGVQLGYDRRHRYAWGETWSFQLLPEGGVNLGNVRTDAHLGGSFRAGYNIPNEFGLNDSTHGVDFGAYIFGGVSGRAVLVDIFLDGNNFRNSHHINKEPFVGEGWIGGAFATRHMEVSVKHVQRTYEFQAQKETDGFTSLTLTVKF